MVSLEILPHPCPEEELEWSVRNNSSDEFPSMFPISGRKTTSGSRTHVLRMVWRRERGALGTRGNSAASQNSCRPVKALKLRTVALCAANKCTVMWFLMYGRFLSPSSTRASRQSCRSWLAPPASPPRSRCCSSSALSACPSPLVSRLWNWLHSSSPRLIPGLQPYGIQNILLKLIF